MEDEPLIKLNKDLTYIGYASFRDRNQIFGIKRKDRRQHMYILGKSGTGKSVLMSNMMMQNIINGEGVCVVDPHGELVEGILQSIPPHRIKDVVYFNPSDVDHHIGFNVLELVDSKYKHLVASGLMGIFTKIWANAWSARMEYILNNTILALLDTPGTTLLGIPRMLVDKDYRQKIINNLKDPVIKAFWVHEYEAWQDKFRNEAIAPIQNKVGQFLSTSVIRNIVGQSKSTINIFDMMNEGKIFLVNVSKGRIGEDNSKLLGGMIITKIQLAAMERVRIPEEERKDFYLYVDEFQNFVTDSFASILSEARKYRLSLTVAHQYTAQLVTKESSAMRDSIFGNVGTMIVFRVGADDADFLEKEFAPEFTPEDIVNLPNFKIYLKLMIDGVTSRPFSAKTIAPLVKGGNKQTEIEVIQSSREFYCRTREEVEDEINKWSGMSLGDDAKDSNNKSNNFTGEKFETVCSNCGNMTSVPFKPEPGRAVYCKDCIVKIKAGEIKPVKVTPDQLKKDETRFFKPLADLGIEFASDGNDSASKPLVYNKSENTNSSKKDFHKTENKPFVKDDRIKKDFVDNNKTKKDQTTFTKIGFGLKDLLDKALNNKDISEQATIRNDLIVPKDEKKTMDGLKIKEIENQINPKDRSAKPETMNSFKNLILEKEKEIVKEEKKEIKIEEPKIQEIFKPEIKKEPLIPVQEERKENIIVKEQITQEVKIETRQDKKQEQEIKSEPIPEKTGTPPPLTKENIQEVPEEVLRKLLEDRE